MVLVNQVRPPCRALSSLTASGKVAGSPSPGSQLTGPPEWPTLATPGHPSTALPQAGGTGLCFLLPRPPPS